MKLFLVKILVVTTYSIFLSACNGLKPTKFPIIQKSEVHQRFSPPLLTLPSSLAQLIGLPLHKRLLRPQHHFQPHQNSPRWMPSDRNAKTLTLPLRQKFPQTVNGLPRRVFGITWGNTRLYMWSVSIIRKNGRFISKTMHYSGVTIAMTLFFPITGQRMDNISMP